MTTPASDRTTLRRGKNRAVYEPNSIRAILAEGLIAQSESDVRKTLVLSLPLVEASAKVRADDPVDEDIDMDGPHWAGVVPLASTWGEPFSAADLRGQPQVPPGVEALRGERARAGATHLGPST